MTDWQPDAAPGADPGRAASFRSLLFVPGHRAEMIAKAFVHSADATVVDWEDAVPAAAKHVAREIAAAALGAGHRGAYIRVNPAVSPEFDADLDAALALAVEGIVLPKAEDPRVVDEIRRRATARGRPGFGVVLGIETAIGVDTCRALLAAGASAAYFGAEDYIADLGGVRTEDGNEVLYARSRVALAARLAGVPAIDQAVVAFRDDERFRADAQAGRALGYQGKICIHPRQVQLTHELFTPSEDEVGHARRVLAVANEGAGTVDGQMVDAVHVLMARRLLARAGLDS